jgi:hypothetical protein
MKQFQAFQTPLMDIGIDRNKQSMLRVGDFEHFDFNKNLFKYILRNRSTINFYLRNAIDPCKMKAFREMTIYK